MQYFAYGSNLWQPRIERRVGKVNALGRACLRGHELRWHKRSSDGSGKCDIVLAKGGEVYGVLYELPDASVASLDLIEGVGRGYERIAVVIDIAGRQVTATTYRATAMTKLLPYDWYKELVVAGARLHALPGEYIGQLECQRSQRDANDVRAAGERSQLGRGTSGA
jgi:gamma-glutamylcyclotransferase